MLELIDVEENMWAHAGVIEISNRFEDQSKR